MKHFKTSLLAAACMVAFMPLQAEAGSKCTRDVVYDSQGNIVHNTFGNCVRTKWDIGMDKCADAPKPKPMPSHAPEKADLGKRSFLVFFDWDKANVTANAQDVLRSIYRKAKDFTGITYQLVGHADRSGTDSYNMGLSKRRAQAVKRELESLGVKSGDIKLDWKGERDPLVPTKDGIREPQNRRTEIKLMTK